MSTQQFHSKASPTGPSDPVANLHRVRDAHDAFLVFEGQKDVWGIEGRGEGYWHQVRYEIFGRVLGALGLMSGQRQTNWSLRHLVQRSDFDPRRWREATQRSLLHDIEPADLIVFNHPRHVLAGDRWICPYTNPLLESIDHSRLVLKDTHLGHHPHPLRTRGLKYISTAITLRRLVTASRYMWRGHIMARQELDQARALIDDLQRTFDIQLPKRSILPYIEWSVCTIMALRELYSRLLDRVRPRAIIQVVHYSYRCLPMTHLARARGIPVVEVQHGTLGETHLAYNLSHGFGRERFPDYLFTFSDFWRDTTPGLPLDSEHAPAIGYAWLEEHLAEARARAPARGREKVALVISQGSIGGMLSRWAVDLGRALEGTGWRVRYRLHPGERDGWRSRYPWLLHTPIEVLEGADTIYRDFASADAQIGVYSTALFEGIAFGLPTLIAACPGHEVLLPLVDAGAATLCEDASSLARALRNAEPPSHDVRERVWKPNAKANFRRFMERLV